MNLTESQNDTNLPGSNELRLSHGHGGPIKAMLALLLVVVLAVADYSQIIFSESRMREALELIKPGMRLTQAERTLNGAGYVTLYMDESPPWLQVSSLNRWPLTADLLHRVFPHSAPDVWLRTRLSGLTRFYVAGETDGAVKFSSDGRSVVSRPWRFGDAFE